MGQFLHESARFDEKAGRLNKTWNFGGGFGVLSSTMVRFVAIAVFAASSGYFAAVAGAPRGALASNKDPRAIELPNAPEGATVIDVPTLRANDKLVLENRELRRIVKKLEKDLDDRRAAAVGMADDVESVRSLSSGGPEKISLLGESRSGDQETGWGSVNAQMHRMCTKTFRPNSALNEVEKEELRHKLVNHSQIMRPVPGGIVLTSCEEESVAEPPEERWSESVKESNAIDDE